MRVRRWWERVVSGVLVAGVLVASLLVGAVRSETAAAALGPWPTGVAAARDAQGRLVVVTATSVTVSATTTVAKAEAWRQACPGCGWVRLGDVAWFTLGVPSLSLGPDGRLELISWSQYGDSPPVLRVVRETCPGCGFVTGDPYDVTPLFEELDVPPPPPVSWDLGVAVGTNPDGRRELFTRGADGEVWHTWEWCAGCGWSAWQPLSGTGGAVVGTPAVAANADGRLEVFVRLASGELRHVWQWCGGGCGWSAWSPADGQGAPAATSPGLGRNADGRLEVFAGVDGVLAHSWQECPGCGWTPWEPVDGHPAVVPPPLYPSNGEAPNIGVAPNSDGRLEAFFHRLGAPPEHVWQLCAGCWWGPTMTLSA